MPDIDIVLSTLPWKGRLREALEQALTPAEVIWVSRHDAIGIRRALKRADVAILAGDLDAGFLDAPRLTWVHCGHAGLERSAMPEVFERGLVVTSAAGRSAPALAEHAMFFMLALSFRYPRFYDAQRAHRWGVRGQHELRALYGRTVGILGLGHTGLEIARRAKAFGMRVVAYRRRPKGSPHVDRLYSAARGETLDELLQTSDFVVLSLPLTDRTRRLIGPIELSRMRPTAYLVNIARGGLVDESAMIGALRAGRLAGAAIDVAEDEPLPAASPLWDTPNLIITPHVTPLMPDRDERALELLRENIRRYRCGEPLLNRLTLSDVYRPHVTEAAGKASGLRGAVIRLRRLARRLAHRWRTR
jgi:phosphoglycerate dehydrogenase-like enzyme